MATAADRAKAMALKLAHTTPYSMDQWEGACRQWLTAGYEFEDLENWIHKNSGGTQITPGMVRMVVEVMNSYRMRGDVPVYCPECPELIQLAPSAAEAEEALERHRDYVHGPSCHHPGHCSPTEPEDG